MGTTKIYLFRVESFQPAAEKTGDAATGKVLFIVCGDYVGGHGLPVRFLFGSWLVLKN